MIAARLAVYYAALFAAVGTQLPFWPLWLKDQGLSPAEIGLVISVIYATKVVVNPVVGHVVDRWGGRRRAMVALAGAAALTWLAFSVVEGFWAITAVTVVSVGCWSAVMPVGESLALAVTHRHGLDYGRVRLWGSAAFIVAAIAVGRLLTEAPSSVLVWLVAALLGATALACAGLPDEPVPSRSGRGAVGLGALAGSGVFLVFLATASLNQAAHTVYYAFSTIHWKEAGIGDDVIGALWSEGVIAEIVLFAFSGRVVARVGPSRLLLLAAVAGALRWTVLGLTTALPALVAAQMLHAATFGCAHLGAMHFLLRAVPPHLSVRAQGLFAAVAAGAAPGLMSPLAGGLYEGLGGGAFLAMTGLSILAGVLAWRLARAWDGGRVVGD